MQHVGRYETRTNEDLSLTLFRRDDEGNEIDYANVTAHSFGGIDTWSVHLPGQSVGVGWESLEEAAAYVAGWWDRDFYANREG